MPVTTLQRRPSVAPKVQLPQETPDCILPIKFDNYLTMIFESFLGQLFPSQGLLLLNAAGQPMHSNAKARELCQVLHQANAMEPKSLPSQITTLCEYLRDGLMEFPGQPLQLNDTICLDGVRIRLNAEWIELEGQESRCILVRLEDVTQTAGQRALCDAIRYGLTQRETEVWGLYLQGLSYCEIAQQLYISMSTVKKHMKNVHSKRRANMN